jgi:Ca2+-binding EF-hand superfamily protein
MEETTQLSEAQVSQYISNLMDFVVHGNTTALDDMFVTLDRNGDGTVSRAELKTVMDGLAKRSAASISES